ncbi:site-specific integrase [Halobacterium salinarum]|uniref:tyrosine-type recombinase/integrase n=1 Tax=Halobacterium salinarum TaxID=2242 RepID=UPI002554C6E3|nr:site-specific integrase [Halobacterium salinarum]MDL0135654.1 site-specific integrase [Halobacterium salinarum]MDL0140573.1 site-specific integrase [Halobacterium salinarum]
MSNPDYGTVRHGNDPTRPPLDWFVYRRHNHSADANQRKIKYHIGFFKRWLNDEFDWIIYEDDDQRTIEEKRDEYGSEVLRHESESDWTTGGDKQPETLSIDDARDYFHALAANPNYGGASEEGNVQTIKQFYDFCLKRGHSLFTGSGNPIELAIDEGADKIIGTVSSRNPKIIAVDEMADYIQSFQHPLWEAITALMAKTTIRRGVIINVDLQDIYLDHPACTWGVHKALRHKERPFLYVPSAPEKGALWEERERVPTASNKSSVDRTIPLDGEMVDLLLRWLAAHPGPLESDTPLFTSVSDHWGQRISPSTVAQNIRGHSKELGYWYEAYDDDNINPHYFRHWATSTIDERLEAASSGEHATTTKLLRGDEEDTMDNYTHWSDDRVERYIDVSPRFYD